VRWSFLLILAIWIAIHAYFGRRMISTSAWKPAHKRIAWGALFFFASLTPAGQILLRGGGLPSAPLATLVYLVMGVSSLLIFFLISFDIARLVHALSRRLGRAFTGHRKSASVAVALQAEAEEPDPQRRAFFARLGRVGLLGGSGGLTAAGYVIARRTPPVEEVVIEIAGLPEAFDGYHVVQITDVHVGPTIRKGWLTSVVQAVNELDPDMVAATGDLIDGHVRDFEPEVSPFGELRSRDGVFYVTGNHEYYWEGDAWCSHFESLGMTVLNNRHVVLERDGQQLVIAGVTDRSAGARLPDHASDPARALAGRPESATTLMLAHRPRSVFEVCEHDVQLQLSGHTHGGQYFPFSALISLFQPFAHGLHLHRGTQLYVSRGTGYWGPPMRAGSTSEITSIRLRRA
jgi:predicted MPP superfamily phosphohydrolase